MLRTAMLLVVVIGNAGCQGSVPTRSSEQGNEEREAVPVIAFEPKQQPTALSPNLVGGLPQTFPQQALEEFERADLETRRLPPAAFTDLPADVIADLERRGCTIPQVFGYVEQSNVVRGRFTSSDRTDIAVLCSKERVSAILVFRGSSTSDVVELDPAPDRFYLQDTGDGIGFSRMIGVATPGFIRDHYAAYGGPAPPRLDHDGIDDAFVEKGSSVWYQHDGEWLELTGSD